MVLFLLIFAVHIFMEIDFNDDQVYTGIIRKKDLWQTLVYSYESGRELFCRYWYSVLYGFLRKFAGGLLWKPVMAGFYTMIPVCIYKLFGEDRSKRSTAVGGRRHSAPDAYELYGRNGLAFHGSGLCSCQWLLLCAAPLVWRKQ